jgi:hypothetical protein
MGPRHAARDLSNWKIFEMAKREDLSLPIAQRREAIPGLIDRALEIQLVFGSARRVRDAGAQQLVSRASHALVLCVGAPEPIVHRVSRNSVDPGHE